MIPPTLTNFRAYLISRLIILRKIIFLCCSVTTLKLLGVNLQGLKRKNEDMEVDQGKALANAFISMEDLFREHKEKADRENDDVVNLCDAAGRAKEKEKDRQAKVIVDSAVAAAAKFQDEARKIISHPFEDFFQK